MQEPENKRYEVYYSTVYPNNPREIRDMMIFHAESRFQALFFFAYILGKKNIPITQLVIEEFNEYEITPPTSKRNLPKQEIIT